MGRRLNNLEDTYNTLVAANFNFDSLPANNKFRRYAEWKQNPERRELPNGAVPTRGSDRPVQISPFGLPLDPDNNVRIGVSGRAYPQITTSLGGFGLYNLTENPADNVRELVGYVPAKAILAVRLPQPDSVEASANRITGRAYKTRSGQTYTIPFGAQTESSREFSVQGEILADRNATHYVTFTPERLRRA